MILDLGCGGNLHEGAVGIDITPNGTAASIICNLGFEPIPLDDNVADKCISHHFIEHVPFAVWDKKSGVDKDGRGTCVWERYLPMVYLFNEIYRVLKHNGTLFVTVPLVINGHVPHQQGWQDPTHCCYSDDTEVLTESGFKPIVDVGEGELIQTLDYETGNVSLAKCIKKFEYKYDGNLIHFKTRVMDILVTPNHRMLTGTNNEHKDKNANWKIQEAADLLKLKGHHSRRAFTNHVFSGNCPDTIAIPRIDRPRGGGKPKPVEFDAGDFMEFMGWYLSEGNLGIKENFLYQVSIGQSRDANPDKYERIFALISRMGLNPFRGKNKITFASKDFIYYLKPLGDSHNKYIPVELKSLHPNLLQRMLDSLILGDGRKNGNAGAYEYASVSRFLADDVQEIAIKCGYRTTIFIEKRSPVQWVINRICHNCRTEMFIVGIAPNKVQYYPKPTEVKYSGNVHCLEVEKNNIILVRRNGRVCWSGNSFWTPETVRYFSGDFYGFHEVYGHTSRFELTGVDLSAGWFMRFEMRAIKNLPADHPYLLKY